jgi:RING-box protein 1
MTSIFTINKINLISSSTFISKNTDCTICRENINNDSIYAQSEGNRSTIQTGLCGHSFHKECILPWLKHNSKCPICIQNFK